jgi:type I restriction enzyme R subunit
MNKKDLSERDICSKFIGPAIKRAGWDGMMQIREEVAFTKGRIIVRGKLVTRGKAKRADYILYYKPNIPIAIIEAKDNSHSVGDGMQQALDYATTLNIPFVFSSNGDGFVFHDGTGIGEEKEATLTLDQFPTPRELWTKYCSWKGLTPAEEEIVLQDYFDDGSGKAPRYYQTNAINAATEAIAKGQDRVLLVMATGTGKTYTAFQIIWRLWKAGRKKRFASLDDFLKRWKSAERKQAIIEELENEGLSLEPFAEEVGKDLDPFDLICHVAFDQPPLTRNERADNVRKRNVFTKYGPQARAVLEALLQKYQDQGVLDLGDPRILQVPPLDKMGTPVQLIKEFGTRADFLFAVQELQSALYQR